MVRGNRSSASVGEPDEGSFFFMVRPRASGGRPGLPALRRRPPLLACLWI